MDDRRFDGLAMRYYVQTTRRAGLRAMTAGLLAGKVGTSAPDEAAAACGLAGDRCDKGADCCSGLCKKIGRRGIGHCSCKANQDPCRETPDCCDTYAGAVCGRSICFSDYRCCGIPGAPCFSACDCCGVLTCRDSFCNLA